MTQTIEKSIKVTYAGEGIRELASRLEMGYKEKDGCAILGGGHVETEGRNNRMYTERGTARMNKIMKNPDWGVDAYIELDVAFQDKELVKNINAKWDVAGKHWCLPFNHFVELFKVIRNVTISLEVTMTLKAVISKVGADNIDLDKKPMLMVRERGLNSNGVIDISDFNLAAGMNINLFDHQKKAVKFCLENKRVVLGLAVGLGKTPTAIASVKQLINDGTIKRAIVVAPSSVKYNWKEEVEKFSDMKPIVLDSSNVKGRKAEGTWAEAVVSDIIIVNYEMLRSEDLCKELYSLAPDCIIADEAHKLKNSKAKQTKGFVSTWKIAEYKFFLSATPFPNGKPKETHTILHHLQPKSIGTWGQFGKRFVEWERKSAFGAKPIALRNVDLLKEEMADIVFMRNHNSSDVTTSLPKERHFTFNLDMTKEQKRLYTAVAEDIMSEISEMESSGISASSPAVIAKLKKLEQIAIDPDMLIKDFEEVDMSKLYPKEEFVVETTVSHLDNKENRGIVIFSDMKLPLQKIKQGLVDNEIPASQIAFITGEVAPEERTAVQKKFAEGKVRVVLCTNAAEEGVNLQHGGHTLIHVDQPWVPKAVTQREGRVLRTGQPNAFTSFLTPIMKDTVEDRKRGTLGEKIGNIEELLGKGTAGSAANNLKADTKGAVTFDMIKGLLG